MPEIQSDEDEHHISMEDPSQWRPEPSFGQPHEGVLTGSSRAEPVFDVGQDGALRSNEVGDGDLAPTQSAYRPSVVKQRDQAASSRTSAIQGEHAEKSRGPTDQRVYASQSQAAANPLRAHATSNPGSTGQRRGEAVSSWTSSTQSQQRDRLTSNEPTKEAPPPQLPPHLPRSEPRTTFEEHDSEGVSRGHEPKFESTHYLRAGRGQEPTISDPISGGTRAPQVPPIYVEPRRHADDVDRPAPDFLEDAGDRGWSGPMWLVLVVVGLMAMAAQLAYIYRNQVAQAAPWTRPILQQACQPLGCTVDYARRIDHISIMSSSLQAQPGQDPGSADRQLTLNVVLRNTFGYAQEWPNLTLDLVDVSGSRVARRILAPQDYLPTAAIQTPFPPQSEMHLSIPVAVKGHQVNGYQLGKYYP